MRIYTEVNYIWKDDKLVKTDSKSFEYEGEVDQCHSATKRIGNSYIGYKTVNIPHSHKSINDLKPKGGTLADVTNVISETVNQNTDTVSQEYDRWEKAHKTNMQYAKEYLSSQTTGQIEETASGLLEENQDETSLEQGLGTRGTMAGRDTDASASTSNVRRDIRKKNAPTLINQQMQKRLQA